MANSCIAFHVLSQTTLTFSQEFNNLKKLGDSLLTRSSKLTDLIGKIESEMVEKEVDSPERKRAEQP